MSNKYDFDFSFIEECQINIGNRGWIFMNGEAIVPIPEIYNKVAELLGCPKISQEGSND